MEKFEIVNQKWIKLSNTNGMTSCRIESIDRIDFQKLQSDSEFTQMKYAISLHPSGGNPVIIWYSSLEWDSSQDDLATLENLLYNQ